MKRLTLQQKALVLIENLVGDDFAEDLDMQVSFDHVEVTEGQIRQAAAKIGKVYVYAHAVNGHSCSRSHDGWRDSIREDYRKFQRSRHQPVTSSGGVT